MRRRAMYDSRVSLNACEHKSLNRQLGLYIEEPSCHRGMKMMTVNVEYETITVNTQSFGSVCPYKDWKLNADKSLVSIIKGLDRVIEELIDHRRRLKIEHEALTTSHLPLSKLVETRRNNEFIDARNKVRTADEFIVNAAIKEQE